MHIGIMHWCFDLCNQSQFDIRINTAHITDTHTDVTAQSTAMNNLLFFVLFLHYSVDLDLMYMY